MDVVPPGGDVTCNVSTELQYGFSKASKSMYNLKGQQVSMIGHGPPTQQGAYAMDSSSDHGTDADRQNNLVDHDNMTQLNVQKCMLDNSSHVGQLCQRLGCSEFVEGRTVFCKGHIIGPRCQMLGYPQNVPYGSALCMPHGGRRPHDEPCPSTVASGKSEASIKYEGDNGFIVTGNASNALGVTGIHSVNGEIVMCKHEGCIKRAQGNTMYCKVHSGVSKRCIVQGCTKGAHGGTPLCICPWRRETLCGHRVPQCCMWQQSRSHGPMRETWWWQEV